MESFVQATTTEYHEFGDPTTVAEQPVVIAKPKGKKPAGLTFVLTAANISVNKYKSIRDALLSIDHIVVGFYINALNPPRRNHRVKAEKVQQMWRELKKEYNLAQYNMVGHSIGGKIALLVAAAYDVDHSVRNVVALDPVDQTPPEFTNEDSTKNINLWDCKASITATYTDSGFFVQKAHNARAIQSKNPDVQLINHRNAGHMCYCDDEQGMAKLSWKAVAGSGNKERNEVAKKEALRIIKEKSMTATGKLMKKAKKAVTGEVKNIKSMGDDVKNAKNAATSSFLKKSLGF